MNKTPLIVIAMVLCLTLQGGAVGLNYGIESRLANITTYLAGESTADYAGGSVAFIGDVNGDGYDDMLIGARAAGFNAGAAYLVLGRSERSTIPMNLANANASFQGENDWDFAGHAVAGAGDVNGDGYDDFLVSAPGFDCPSGMTDCGKVYLFFGRAAPWNGQVSLAIADASFVGGSTGEQAGETLDGAGDVNGDGFNDFLIGTEFWDNSRGQTYLILGGKAGWAKNSSLYESDASFQGEVANDKAGFAISGAGDVNADGFDDILIGAFNSNAGYNAAGQTYLVLGRPSGLTMNISLSVANASWWGESAGDASGYSVSGAGDVNGDGYDDILIGAPYNSAHSSMAGIVYLIFGQKNKWTMDQLITIANASFYGQDSDDNAGQVVASAGDVNGDGFDDILVSAPADETQLAQVRSGQTYLILGKAAGWVKDKTLYQSDASFMGQGAQDISGMALAGNGDIDGDGLDDILIGAPMGDLGGSNSGQAYLIHPDTNEPPLMVQSVMAYLSPNYGVKTSSALMFDTVYIELQGTDSNSSRKSTARVTVTNTRTQIGLDLRLNETGYSTGVFHGSFRVMKRAQEDYRWISATGDDKLDIASFTDPTKKTVITIGRPVLNPVQDVKTVLEDSEYKVKYTAENVTTGTTWEYTSNASWLFYNVTTKTINGTPSNADVGDYWVKLNVSDDTKMSDEHNFTLSVLNVAPKITTSDITSVWEGSLYLVDYNSTDDGEGNVGWAITTNATFLSLNATTGILNGVPLNKDVGSYYVNLTVDDGNGGFDDTNFTLSVWNINQPPVIPTTDVTTILEEANYNVTYSVIDPDSDEVLTWSFGTNATGWLHFNSTTGRLNGTPSNEDVGVYWVNVTVHDLANARDVHNFTLTVVNVNDLPVIDSTPSLDAWSGVEYWYDFNATDIDKVDTVVYSLEVTPAGMNINPATGMINWIPSTGQIGMHQVVVRAADTTSHVNQSFNITVHAPHPPKITSTTGNITGVGENYTYDVDAIDNATAQLTYYLGLHPGGMTINSTTGLITWTPNASQVGDNDFVVIVSDGMFSTSQEYSVKVHRLNLPPTITSALPKTKVYAGDNFKYQVHATDPDASEVLTFHLEDAPPGMSIDPNNGFISWRPKASDVGSHQVQIVVVDSIGAKDDLTFTITVKKKPETLGGQTLLLILIAVVLIVVVCVLAVALFMIRRRMAINDIFLIYKDGRLISHHTTKLKPDVDDEVLGGMFTAIQDFIKTSFGTDEDEAAPVKEIAYGTKKILIEHGKFVFLAAVIEGQGSKAMHERMNETLNSIESELGLALETWSGDKAELKGTKKWLKALISGKPMNGEDSVE